MINDTPLVSIIIPCRNEEKFIGKCLDSIIAQDYSKEKLEVLVVDGMSVDGTKDIIKEYSQKYPFIRVLDNPKKVTPVAMNIGIKNATGDFMVMINSHAIIDNGFLINGIKYLNETNADAVGGILKTINEGKDIISRVIPLSADSIFGAGGKRYRSRIAEGFVSDTLPYCLYKKEVFFKIGLIDEELIRDQDEEFNYRLIKNGGRIYFSPLIKSFLYLRPSLKKLWRQHFQYGYFKPLVAKKVGAILTARQLIPAIFVFSLIISGILSFVFIPFLWLFLFISLLYLSTNLLFSLCIAFKKGMRLLPFLLISFATLHFSYGLGYLKGIWDFIVLRKHKRKKVEDIPLTR
ncbi:MAG: glycosyltransferase family 2 protein [bacterium]